MKKLTWILLFCLLLSGCSKAPIGDSYQDIPESSSAEITNEDTGLFYFKGTPGEKFAICNAGGTFAFVGAMHDSNGTAPPDNMEPNKETEVAPPPSDPEPESEPTQPSEASKVNTTLVVYFSASGNTEKVADYIAEGLGADTFELVPVEPYTDDDLNWRKASSRVNREHDDPALQNIELKQTTVPHWEDYDTVFIGYPLWWRAAAWPVNSFIKANDFTGKTVIPFCTSTSDGFGDSGAALAEMAGSGNWLKGSRFREKPSEEAVKEWVKGLSFNRAAITVWLCSLPTTITTNWRVT